MPRLLKILPLTIDLPLRPLPKLRFSSGNSYINIALFVVRPMWAWIYVGGSDPQSLAIAFLLGVSSPEDGKDCSPQRGGGFEAIPTAMANLSRFA